MVHVAGGALARSVDFRGKVRGMKEESQMVLPNLGALLGLSLIPVTKDPSGRKTSRLGGTPDHLVASNVLGPLLMNGANTREFQRREV